MRLMKLGTFSLLSTTTSERVIVFLPTSTAVSFLCSVVSWAGQTIADSIQKKTVMIFLIMTANYYKQSSSSLFGEYHPVINFYFAFGDVV